MFALVVIGYAMISVKWWQAVQNSEGEARTAWRWMIMIFCFCAFSGYGTPALSAWYPQVGFGLRAIFLAILVTSCVVFLWYARRVRFYGFGTEQALGHRILAGRDRLKGMTNDQKAEFLMASIEAKGVSIERAISGFAGDK